MLAEENAFSLEIIIGFLLLLLTFLWYQRRTLQPRCKTFPPGPRGIPLLGVLPYLGKYPERVLRKWSQIYGPVISVRMGTKDWVFLNDLDSVHQAFALQPTKTSGRPFTAFVHKQNEGYGIIMLDYGNVWKSQKKFGMTALRGFGGGGKTMEKRIVEELSYLNNAISQENERPFDISIKLRSAISNNIFHAVVGKRFEYDDKDFQNALHLLLSGCSSAPRLFVCSLFLFCPLLMSIPPFSFVNNAVQKEIRIIKDFLQNVLNEHKETFDKEIIGNFADAFTSEMKKNEDHTFTEKQLVNYVWDLFIAGTETSSTVLDWALLCLLHFPHSQTKLRKEIEDVIGLSGKVSMKHKPLMHYTNAFIEEVMRYRTPVPLGVMHCTSEDTEINGYVIPKGTTLATNLWAVHNDSAVWDQPEKFIPERFLNENGDFVKFQKVIPFSIGPRGCLGKQLAVMEIFIFLVGMVQKFQFLPDPETGKLPDINSGSNGTVFATKSFKIVAKEI